MCVCVSAHVCVRVCVSQQGLKNYPNVHRSPEVVLGVLMCNWCPVYPVGLLHFLSIYFQLFLAFSIHPHNVVHVFVKRSIFSTTLSRTVTSRNTMNHL